MTTKNKPNEIYISRVYDAPVKTVWEAWVDPVQVAKWWGPRGFTITTTKKDVRTGGTWVYTMHGPDGIDWPNVTQFLEVEKFSRLVYDHGASEGKPPMFRVTVQFTELNGKTKMDMSMALPTAEAAQVTKKFIKKAGGDSTWDRLAEFLGDAEGKKQFVINRSFNTPLQTMFDMWTKPEHLSKWVPPTGFTMTYLSADIKPGGTAFYYMTPINGDESKRMYGRADYIEITRPNRVIYTQQFMDENRNLARHPMAPTWPATMLTTVNLTDEGDNQTRVTITWDVHGDATPIEIETFLSARGGMTQGWSGSFDKLEDYLLQN